MFSTTFSELQLYYLVQVNIEDPSNQETVETAAWMEMNKLKAVVR